MNAMIGLLLRAFVMTHSLEAGYIPSYDLHMYIAANLDENKLLVHGSYYFDYQSQLQIAKIFYIDGGVNALSLPLKSFEGYPYRMDFNFGAGIQYKCIKIGYEHRCDHPIAPNMSVAPFPKIDVAQDHFFIKITTNNFIN